MKFYKARNSTWDTTKIEEVEVERATPDSVWINGRRNAKRSGYDNYFDSHDEAKAFLLEKATNEMNRAIDLLYRMEKRIKEINAL